jgi:pimeloyl-ACP methyl ester carboxylesterase
MRSSAAIAIAAAVSRSSCAASARRAAYIAPVPATRRSVDNDGVEIVFDETGRGRTIVWLHGMGEDRTAWDPVTALLADEFRSIRIDFRGHGESGRLPHYEGADLVVDVGAVVQATCDAPPIVVGHSLGGIVATAASAFGITAAAVNVDQSLKDDPFTDLMLSLATRLRDPDTYVDAQLELKFALGMALVPESTLADLARGAARNDPQVALDLWKTRLDGDPDAIRADDAAFEAILGGITHPYLEVHGTPVAPGYEEWLTATIASAQFEAWNGLGHWLHLVEPVRFAQRVRSFVEGVPDV